MDERTAVSRAEIEAAARRIAPHVRETPAMALEAGAFGLPCRLQLKLEFLQHAGSFKPRGAFNRLLQHEVPGGRVLAASGGNHGIAVAHAARALGHRAEIFVPTIASPVKVARLRALGAEVTVAGADFAEAYENSRRRMEEAGGLYVHPYDDPDVIAGQGTVGLELERQVPGLESVLVAVGGGGLISGIASWFAGTGTRVVGAEPVAAPTLARALEAGGPTDVAVGGMAADSLGARRTGALNHAICSRHVERVVLVAEEAIAEAQAVLWRECRIVVEPGAAVAFAALLSGAYRPAEAERLCVLLCGANTDPASIPRD